jgi:hydroxybutyrate-dimer hydrolase
MNKFGASVRLGLLSAAVGLAMSGCNSDSTANAEIAETIVGVASDGVGIANINISIMDAQKTTIDEISTDANGRFQFNPGSRSYPFMLSVASNGKTYYSLVTGADKQVNINPATTVITQLALGSSQLASAYANATFKTVTAAKIAQAEAHYLQAMRADSQVAAALFDTSPRTKDYQPGSKIVDGDAYQQYMAMVEPTLSLLDGRVLLLNNKPYRFGDYKTVEHKVSDDLLSAGLGDAGMLGPAPGYSGLLGSVTAAELRKNAIYNAYHALTDLSANGGYGALWPKVSQVPGVEYLGYADSGDGSRNVSTLVQIPDAFDTQKPCIVVVPSTGLAGIYTANPTAEWGLKRGCAVAVTDKGAGTGAEYIDTGESYQIDGMLGSSSGTTTTLQFKTGYTNEERLLYKADHPHRFAFKFAHSRHNPQQHWGQNTLDAIKFAFYLLNERFGPVADVGGRKLRSILPENTSVILAGSAEGATAVLAAAERDVLALVDGAVLAQPNAYLDFSGVSITQGGQAVAAAGKSPADYLSYANLYQPCAALAEQGAPGAAEIDSVAAANRCAALKQKGLLAGDSLGAQARESQDKLLAYGWQPDSAALHGVAYVRATAGSATAYISAYAKPTALDNMCDLSYAVVNSAGAPVFAEGAFRRTLFANGNGMPPYAGIDLINNAAAGGARHWAKAISVSSALMDYSFDTAYCLRRLALGRDPITGVALVDKETRDADGKLISTDWSGTWAANVKNSLSENRLSAVLQGKPAIILHGRSDPQFPVNHGARPYVAKSLASDGVRSKLRYYEVLNAHHWDAVNAVAGFDTRYVPLRPYLQQSLDLMYSHLTLNQALPQSQVLRTTPRGGTAGAAPALTTANVPPIAATPAENDLIRFSGSTLSIPN